MLTPVQVATGAGEMYSDEVQQIQNLSHHGTQQLLADLEYFCNVLAALGVALPAGLSTWQVLIPSSVCLFHSSSFVCSVLADGRCCQSAATLGKARKPPVIFTNPTC